MKGAIQIATTLGAVMVPNSHHCHARAAAFTHESTLYESRLGLWTPDEQVA